MKLKIEENWTSSWTVAGRKTSAVAFIVLILNANFWLLKRFFGEECPQWAVWIFILGAVGALLGFLMMLPGLLNPKIINDNSSEDSESTNRED